jgi:hypothetical protein
MIGTYFIFSIAVNSVKEAAVEVAEAYYRIKTRRNKNKEEK